MNTDGYYIWADGQEQGPFELRELITRWRMGELPKGFLWRREHESHFLLPSDLVDEESRAFAQPIAPPPPKPKQETTAGTYLAHVQKHSQYRQLRFWLGITTGAVGSFGVLMSFGLGVLVFSQTKNGPAAGVFGIASGITALSITAALDQSVRMLIDAVDTLIDNGRHRHQETLEEA